MDFGSTSLQAQEDSRYIMLLSFKGITRGSLVFKAKIIPFVSEGYFGKFGLDRKFESKWSKS
jgi:hypothetical protein